MAYSYPNIQQLTSYAFIYDFVAWLLDDETSGPVSAWKDAQGGTGGPGWSIIEAYGRDSGTASVARAIPPTITTGNGALDDISNDGSLVGSLNGFGTGTNFEVGFWIVLESAGTNPFQLYIEIDSTTSLALKLIPLASKGGSDAFTTGGTATSPAPAADFPATSVPAGATTTFRAMPVFAATADYSGVSDDRMVAFFADDATNPSFLYVGDLDNAHPTDAYPYVIRDFMADAHWNYGDVSTWDRLSPIDEETLLTAGCLASFYRGVPSGNYLHVGGSNSLAGEDSMVPVGVYFQDQGHRHIAGVLKHVYSVSDDAGFSGTINDPNSTSSGDLVGPNSPGIINYIWRNDTSVSPGIGMSWDGFTTYP